MVVLEGKRERRRKCAGRGEERKFVGYFEDEKKGHSSFLIHWESIPKNVVFNLILKSKNIVLFPKITVTG